MKNFNKKVAICKKAVEKWVGKVDFVGAVFYAPYFDDDPREEGFVFMSPGGVKYFMGLFEAKQGYYPAFESPYGSRGYTKYPPEPWEFQKW